MSIESQNQSTYFFRQLRALQSRAEALQQDISDIESLVSQVVTTQENQIGEIQSLANPYSNWGEAICNQRESSGNYDWGNLQNPRWSEFMLAVRGVTTNVSLS